MNKMKINLSSSLLEPFTESLYEYSVLSPQPCIICFIVNHYLCCSADVHITVKDVNEFIPEWSQEEYSGEVEEGEIAEIILQVHIAIIGMGNWILASNSLI